jgi:hypothetical protein
MLFNNFSNYESEAKRLMELSLALPAYEMVLKAAHTFNLLDARGAISVTSAPPISDEFVICHGQLLKPILSLVNSLAFLCSRRNLRKASLTP